MSDRERSGADLVHEIHKNRITETRRQTRSMTRSMTCAAMVIALAGIVVLLATVVRIWLFWQDPR